MDGVGSTSSHQDMEGLREQQITELQQQLRQQHQQLASQAQQLEQAGATVNALQAQLQQLSVGNNGAVSHGPRMTIDAHKCIKLAPLERISGRNTAQLRDWFTIARTNVIANHLNPDSTEAVQYVASHFKMPLARWWARRVSESSADTGGFLSFDELAEAAMKMYVARDPESVAREKLDKLVQRKSVVEYVHQFEDLQSQIHERSPKDRLFDFIKGLKTTIKEKVQVQDPQTYEEAVRIFLIAETFDTILYGQGDKYRKTLGLYKSRVGSGSSVYPRGGYFSNRSGPQPMELGHLHNIDFDEEASNDESSYLYHLHQSEAPRHATKHFRMQQRPERNQTQKASGCIYCRQRSHDVKTCPLAKIHERKKLGFNPRHPASPFPFRQQKNLPGRRGSYRH